MAHTRVVRLEAVAVLLALATALAADRAGTASAQPTFRAEVTGVTTDVIPRDKDGRFVSDLTKDEFVIREDGVAQTLTSITLVHGGRIFNVFAPQAPQAAPEGIVLPTRRRAVEDTAGRVIVIFVDDVHFEPEYTPHVRKLIEEVGKNLLHDGDLVAMMSSGPSSIATGLTYDRRLVVDSANKIRGSGLTAMEIFRMLETGQGPADVRNRAQMAFFAAYDLLGQLDSIKDKRKVLLYISTGYDFDPFPEGRQGTDRIMGGRFSEQIRTITQDQDDNPYFRLPKVNADIDLYSYMRELALSANRANVSIYSIDPRGLAGVVDAGQYIDQSEWRTFLQKTQSTLRFMAETTGGFPVVNVNDFATEFKRIDAETSDYYILGYSSSNPDQRRRTRALDITVTRPGIAVAARTAYSLKALGAPVKPPPPKPSKK